MRELWGEMATNWRVQAAHFSHHFVLYRLKMMLFANLKLTSGNITVISNHIALERKCVRVQMVILCIIRPFLAIKWIALTFS